MGSGLTSFALGADAWRVSTLPPEDQNNPEKARALGHITVRNHGDGELFMGRAGQRHRRDLDEAGVLHIFDQLVAQALADLFAVVDWLYRAASYLGPVDVGVAVTNIYGGYATALADRFPEPPPYLAQDFRRTTRFAAAELADGGRLACDLLRDLFSALSLPETYNPFS